MYRIKYLLIFLFIILISGCSKKEKPISVIKEVTQNQEMVTAYKEGFKSLNEGDPYFAAKKFLEAELLFLNQNGHQNQL